MKIDVYRSATKSDLYISVPADTDINEVLSKLTEPNLAKVKRLKSFDTELRNHPVGMNTDDVIAQIGKNGYAVHGVSVQTTVRTEPL